MTGTPERTLYRKVERFEEEGPRGLFSTEGAKRQVLPPMIRRMIVDLKAEHPALNRGGVTVDVTFVNQKRVAFATTFAISPARWTPSADSKRALREGLREGESSYTSLSAPASAKEEYAWGRQKEKTEDHENGSKG